MGARCVFGTTKGLAVLVGIATLLATPLALAAGQIDVVAPDTFAPGGGAIRVSAGVVDADGVAEARLYFRGDMDDEFAYSQMRSDGSRLLGRIPSPDAAVRTIEYQLLVVNNSNETYTTQVFELAAGEGDGADGQWQEVSSTENAEISAEYLDATAPKSFSASGARFNIVDTTRWYGRVAKIYRNAQLAGSPTGQASLAKDAGQVSATHSTPSASAATQTASTSAATGAAGSAGASASAATGGGMSAMAIVGVGAAVALGAAAAGGSGGDDDGGGGGGSFNVSMTVNAPIFNPNTGGAYGGAGGSQLQGNLRCSAGPNDTAIRSFSSFGISHPLATNSSASGCGIVPGTFESGFGFGNGGCLIGGTMSGNTITFTPRGTYGANTCYIYCVSSSPAAIVCGGISIP